MDIEAVVIYFRFYNSRSNVNAKCEERKNRNYDDSNEQNPPENFHSFALIVC